MPLESISLRNRIRIHDLIKEGCSLATVAEYVDMSVHEVSDVCAKLGIRERHQGAACEQEMVDPTPSEIREACERIQAGWSFGEYRRRQGLPSFSLELTAPAIDYIGTQSGDS